MVLLTNIFLIPYRIIFTKISPLCIIQESKIDKSAAIASGVKFYRGIIGKYSYINRNSFISDTEIGNFCSIGSGCEIGGASHPINWVSTSPVFHKWGNIMKKNFAYNDFDIFTETKIGNDVWIGANCMVKAGVKISDGAVIGMGSVVTKDIGPYEIWAGNPAKLIRKRFDESTINSLIESQWWNMTDSRIDEYSDYITNPNEFIKRII